MVAHSPARRVAPSRSSKGSRVTVDNVSHSFVVGVRVSHPDRVIDPDLGISKIQLVRYFERIAD